jgi:uncharacterized membrane protein
MKNFSILLADKITDFIGSWKFIIIQSTILTLWIILNTLHIVDFDHYPFIFLNLFLSFEAAYATPLILMSSNRSSERDRKHILRDLQLDEEAGVILKNMSEVLNKVSEDIFLDKKTNKDLDDAKEERNKIKADLNLIKQLMVQLTKKIP